MKETSLQINNTFFYGNTAHEGGGIFYNSKQSNNKIINYEFCLID